ncbi:MAG: class I SAM-dependent methyltransferase [Candidatus Bathyarchaeota archaeon]|nr:MAG: class I SAM-dependent methyltransferase [Candidatus Bathyarchaeota archaeon]
MKSERDAFGQMIWACYRGKEVFEVWERNDGYVSVDLAKTYFSEYEDWALHQRKAMEFVRGRVLDVGCGAGRHSLYLQKLGFDVLGIDVSPLAVKVCRLRGLKKVRVMPIEKMNFKPNSFNSIIMMGCNFSLFSSFKKARRLLKKFRSITSEDVLMIAETRDPYKTDNPSYLKYYEFNKNKGRMSGQLRGRIRFEGYISKWFDWLMVSKKEMVEILNETGWKAKEFIESGNSQYIAIIEKCVRRGGD